MEDNGKYQVNVSVKDIIQSLDETKRISNGDLIASMAIDLLSFSLHGFDMQSVMSAVIKNMEDMVDICRDYYNKQVTEVSEMKDDKVSEAIYKDVSDEVVMEILSKLLIGKLGEDDNEEHWFKNTC